MAFWRKPSAADALAEQLRVEQMRKQLADLKVANDKRDAAAAAVEKARRTQEEKEWQAKFFKPWPKRAAFPYRRDDDYVISAARYLGSVALEDGKLREQDRQRQIAERRQAKDVRKFMDEVHQRTNTSANARDTGQARERRRDDIGRGR
jgi:hypothetical protein